MNYHSFSLTSLIVTPLVVFSPTLYFASNLPRELLLTSLVTPDDLVTALPSRFLLATAANDPVAKLSPPTWDALSLGLISLKPVCLANSSSVLDESPTAFYCHSSCWREPKSAEPEAMGFSYLGSVWKAVKEVAAGCLEVKKLLMSFVFSFFAATFLLSSGSLRFLSIGSGALNSACTVLKAVLERMALISSKLLP